MEGDYVFSLFGVLPYYILLAYVLMVYIGNLEKISQAKLCFWALFIFAAIRYGVAYDYMAYKSIILGDSREEELIRFEPFSRILAEIANLTHYQVFFVVGSLLTIYPLYKICIKYSLDPALSLIIYFLYPAFYLDGLGIVRNAIAFSIELYALITLMEGKMKKTVLLLICATLFHKSAALGILILPVLYLCKSRKVYFLMYLLSFFISVLITTLIGAYADKIILLSNAQHYIDTASDRSGGGLMTFIVNGICILNFVFWNKLKETHAMERVFLCSYTVGACLWNIFLPVDIVLASRFCTFFTLSLILIIPAYMLIFEDKYQGITKRIIFSFFILLFTSHFYINVSSYLEHPDKMSTVPYQTVFWYTDYNNL